MVVKTKKGYYVYSAPLLNGRRKRIGGPYPSKSQANKVNRKSKLRTKPKIKRRRKT
jgi:hypothetical protein